LRRITFHPGASSMVQRDENHSVPGQGCREDGPVPPNCSAVTTHACCPAVIKGSAPNPNVFPWHDVNTVHLNKLAMNFGWRCASQTQKSDHTTHLNVWPCFRQPRHLTTDVGTVSVRGSSALPALTWQEIWRK
jgi:hypothetical protein